MSSRLDAAGRRAIFLVGLASLLVDPARAAQALGCLIEAERTADIGSQVVGIIESIAVERGDIVKKGQTLALLKAQPERAAVALAKARQEAEGEVRAAEAAARFAAQQLARNEDLLKRNFLSPNAVDQARADAEVARQKLAQARENRRVASNEVDYSRAQLSQRTIVSPFDGVVTERYLAPGERVEDKPILRVAQVDPLRVQVVAPISLYGQIQPGDSAQIVPELPGATPVRALVARVDKVIDPASNTFRTLLRLDNPAHALPAGLRCKADFAKIGGAAADLPPAAAPAPDRTPAVRAPTAAMPAAAPPPAKTSARAAAPVAPGAEQALATAVDQWRRAWASKQVARYLGYYAKEFVPPRNLSWQAWAAERKQRLSQAEPIAIRIEGLRTTPLAANQARVVFDQHYRAGDFSDTARKELLWRKQGERWLIVRERTLQ